MAIDQEREWDSHLKIAIENVERDRKAQARLRFGSASGEPWSATERDGCQILSVTRGGLGISY